MQCLAYQNEVHDNLMFLGPSHLYCFERTNSIFHSRRCVVCLCASLIIIIHTSETEVCQLKFFGGEGVVGGWSLDNIFGVMNFI